MNDLTGHWHTRDITIVFYITLVLLPMLVYIPTFSSELIWDSKPVIQENNILKNGFSPLAPFTKGYWESTSQHFGKRYDYYRPIMILSYMIENTIWGLRPFQLRFVNLLLFIITLFVLYFLYRRWHTQGSGPTVPRIAVLLFALFPLHLDNILWIVGRCDLLMLLFGVISVLCFDIFLETHRPAPAIFALACFAIALFSKESTLFFLAIFPLQEYLRQRRITPRLYLPPGLIAAAFWLIKSMVLGQSGFPFRLFDRPLENLKALFGAIGYYARNLILPVHFDMFLPLTDVTGPLYLIIGILSASFLLWIPLAKRDNMPLAQSWIWMAPFLAAYMLLIFTPLHPFSISSRYLMIPAIGWCWLLANWIGKIPTKLRHTVIALLLIVWGATIFMESGRYQNELAFWQKALQNSPDNPFFLSKTAEELLATERLIESEALFNKTLRLPMTPQTARVTALSMAEIQFRHGRYAESMNWISQGRKLDPNPYQQRRILQLQFRIHVARAEYAQAMETVNAISRDDSDQTQFTMRLNLNIAFANWPAARALLDTAPVPDRQRIGPEIERMANGFSVMAPAQQALFFQQHGNYEAAWSILSSLNQTCPEELLNLLRAGFLAGRENDVEPIIQKLDRLAVSDYRLLNSMANLLLEFGEKRKAWEYYVRSRSLNPQQLGLTELISFLDKL